MGSLPQIRRRKLLQAGSIGFTGISLPALLRAENASRSTPRAKACLLLYMDGGPSHIDLFDLKPEAPAEIRGPWVPIDTSVPGIRIGELLPLVASQMHHVALVSSVRHEETVHDPAVYQMLTGYKHVSSAGGLKVEETDLPHAGAAFGRADRTPAVMPKVIHLPELMKMESRVLPGQNGGVLGAAADPFLVDVTADCKIHAPPFELTDELTAARLQRRAALLERFNRESARLDSTERLERLNTFQRQAIEILAAPQIERAFEVDREPTTLQDRYGPNRHGQSVLLARRLVEAGARFVTVYWGREPQDWADGKGARPANNPWDTHRNHFPLVRDSLVPRADRAPGRPAPARPAGRDAGRLDGGLRPYAAHHPPVGQPRSLAACLQRHTGGWWYSRRNGAWSDRRPRGIRRRFTGHSSRSDGDHVRPAWHSLRQ
jgi:hypothetical protein